MINLKVLVPLFASALVAACGGGENTISDPGSGSSSSSSSGGSSSSSSATTLRLGSGTGAGFMDGQMALGVTSLSAGGSTSVTVNLVDQNGVPYTQSATVSFTSPCVSNSLATFTPSGSSTPSNTVTTTTGTATATYSAQGCSGADVITASSAVNGQSLAASGTVTVAAAVLGSVEFVSASPATIGLRGTGVEETSTLIFKAVDSSGGPVQGATINFALTTSVGGLTISPSSGTTGIDGTIQTVVQAGTVHTSVRVTATATLGGVTQSTQSNNLTVTTGVPTTAAFSVAPTCSNIEAFDIDGVNSTITVRLADRYNNPVPDGTAVAFTSEGGKIDGQCTTETTSTESGVCSVNWTSQNPRPSNGRVTIMATALGEDSFTDTNANGFYDSGEAYDDLGEPYRDDNESGTYNMGETFLDFDSSGTHDSAYGSFKGITCTGTTSGSTCSLETTAIGGQSLLIMSSSSVDIDGLLPSANWGAAASMALEYTISDMNGNPMPSGTKIDISANSGAGTLDGTTSFTVPCTTSEVGTTVTAYLIKPATGTGTGAVTVKVTSPGGLITEHRTTIAP